MRRLRPRLLGLALVVSSLLALPGLPAAPAWGDEPAVTVLDLRTRAEEGDHAVVFLGRDGPVGHLVVAFGRETSGQASTVEAFGLHPTVNMMGAASVSVGPVPRAVVDDLLGGPLASQTTQLVCQVGAETFSAADAVRVRFAARQGVRLTREDFFEFLGEVTQALGLALRADARTTPYARLVAGLAARGPDRRSGPGPRGIVLPRVGTLGRAPAGDEVVVVEAGADGSLFVGEKGPLGLGELREELAARTADPGLREADGASRLELVLSADAALPWVVGQWIVQVAADPRVRIYRVYFGALPREGESAGAIGCFLPKDRGLPKAEPPSLEVLRVRLLAKGDVASDPEALAAAVASRVAQLGPDVMVVVELKTPPSYGQAVSTGVVVQALDAVARAGAHVVYLEGAMPPPPARSADAASLRSHVATLRAAARPATRFLLNDTVVGTAPPEGTEPPPARGLLDGPLVLSGPDAMLYEEPFLLDEEISEDEGVEEGPGAEPTASEPTGLFARRGADRGGARGPFEAGRRAAVESALAWLAAHQSPDGGWEAAGFHAWCDGRSAAAGPDGPGKAVYDPGVTGLALLAFLGAGYTHRGQHPYAKTVSKGLRYLRNVQDAEGCFGPRTSLHFIYNHALATLAMVEAYGLTESPLFKGSAQKALDFTALSRNPYFAWRYGVKPGDNDTSVTGWMTMGLWVAKAIDAAAVAAWRPPPLSIDEDAFDGVRAWLEKMTDPETGRVGYAQRGGPPARPQEQIDRFPGERSESMTAVGVCLHGLLGSPPTPGAHVARGRRLLAACPPVWNATEGHIDLYYWHYGALATFQAGGTAWSQWREALDRALLPAQRQDTTACLYRGSWDPIDPWGPDGGRVYTTAIAALCLLTEDRYAPVATK